MNRTVGTAYHHKLRGPREVKHPYAMGSGGNNTIPGTIDKDVRA